MQDEQGEGQSQVYLPPPKVAPLRIAAPAGRTRSTAAGALRTKHHPASVPPVWCGYNHTGMVQGINACKSSRDAE